MSTDQQLRDQLAAAAAQPRHAIDLDQIARRARRRRHRRHATYAGSAGLVTAGLAAIAITLPTTPAGPTIDQLGPAPIALLTQPDAAAGDGEATLDRLAITYDPGRTRTLDHDLATLIVTTSHSGTRTCLYARPAQSTRWSGGCKPTTTFLDDGWLQLTINTDSHPTTLAATLTRDDITHINTPAGTLTPDNNLTLTDQPIEGELHAHHPTSPLPTTTTDQAGTILR